MRSNEKTTASALTSVPSWNLTPGRSFMVTDVASGATCHDVARSVCSSLDLPYRLTNMSNMLLTGRKVLVPVITAGSKLLISASMPMISVPPDLADCAAGAADAAERMRAAGMLAAPAASAERLSKSRRVRDAGRDLVLPFMPFLLCDAARMALNVNDVSLSPQRSSRFLEGMPSRH